MSYNSLTTIKLLNYTPPPPPHPPLLPPPTPTLQLAVATETARSTYRTITAALPSITPEIPHLLLSRRCKSGYSHQQGRNTPALRYYHTYMRPELVNLPIRRSSSIAANSLDNMGSTLPYSIGLYAVEEHRSGHRGGSVSTCGSWASYASSRD